MVQRKISLRCHVFICARYYLFVVTVILSFNNRFCKTLIKGGRLIFFLPCRLQSVTCKNTCFWSSVLLELCILVHVIKCKECMQACLSLSILKIYGCQRRYCQPTQRRPLLYCYTDSSMHKHSWNHLLSDLSWLYVFCIKT